MFNIILCVLSVVAQDDDILDRQMAESQEHWVIDSMDRQHPMRGIRPMFGGRVERYIDSLSCLHYGCRTTAAEQLEGMGEAAFRPLVWASRHTDKYIARIATILLEKSFYQCYECHGKGYKKYSGICFKCDGTGNLRYKNP